MLLGASAWACSDGDDTSGDGTGGVAGGGGTGDAGSSGSSGSSGAGGAASVDECLDGAVIQDTKTELLEFVAEPSLAVGLVRYPDPDMMGTSGTTVWVGERFAVANGSVSACVTESANLDYVVSYHNFDDQLVVTSGSVTYTFTQTREGYEAGTIWTVKAEEGGAVSWGPVTLELVRCLDLTSNNDCSGYYAAPEQ
jgi:hypothetical protein